MTDATRPRAGVQLYTLRDAGDDLLTMVPKLGAMGYDGVELYGGQLTGLDPAEVLDVLGAAGMEVSSAHVGLGPDGTVDEAELDRLQSDTGDGPVRHGASRTPHRAHRRHRYRYALACLRP